MDIVLPVIGGLSLFLYGINIMGDSLGKVAGQRLTNLIEVLTTNKLRAVLLGIVVTIMLQSSSAATVMVVGFVNAGLMTLDQTVGVIIGANIGATVTAQLIALDLTGYAPLIMGIGMAIWIFTARERAKSIAELLIGFAMIFIGMGMMSSGFGPLADHPSMTNIIIGLRNPILGVLAGVVITTILQSSAPVVGLIQALSAQGIFSVNLAFPVVFGSNIGTTTTALLSSIGTNKTAKRAAVIHFLFNFLGTIIFVALLMKPVGVLVKLISPNNIKFQIANIHTFFNLINAIILLPFSKLLVKMAEKIVPGDAESETEVTIHLDSRLLENPSIALGQAKKEVLRMGDLVLENLNLSKRVLADGYYEGIDEIFERERLIDSIEREITEYLVDLSNESLSEREQMTLNILLYAINDIERIGDHVDNIAELSLEISRKNLKFSQSAVEGLQEMFDKCEKVFIKAMETIDTKNRESAKEVMKIEEEINRLEEENRLGHIDRLNRRACNTESGIIFLDSISNLERVSDHSSNIARYILDEFKK